MRAATAISAAATAASFSLAGRRAVFATRLGRCVRRIELFAGHARFQIRFRVGAEQVGGCAIVLGLPWSA